jgi:repressor LexA
MNDNLTRKQSELLSYIKSYTSHNGYPPSLKDMASHMGVRSLSTIHQHVSGLQKKGLLAKSTERKRNINAYNVPKLLQIPVLGVIAAGLPIEPIEDPEPVYVSTDLIKSPINHYALKVRGDSMIDDNIQDGDTVIVKSQNHVDHVGQTVVAIVDGGATLKRFGGLTKEGFVKLIPRNPSMPVILTDPTTFEIRGKMVGLMRAVN